MIVVAYNNKAYENEHYRNNDEGKHGKGRRDKYSCLQLLIVSQIGREFVSHAVSESDIHIVNP